jgi:hypothetical protein
MEVSPLLNSLEGRIDKYYYNVSMKKSTHNNYHTRPRAFMLIYCCCFLELLLQIE